MESITRLVIPDGISLCIVVVENDSSTNCQQQIKKLDQTHPNIKFAYTHEPKLGIPIARNRACEEALSLDADWIAFIDDDETIDPHWLEIMSEAIESYPAEVYYGPVNNIINGQLDGDIKPPERKHRTTGTFLNKAATNNSLLDAKFLITHSQNLRFDESMQFTGGSDTRFFYQVTDLGGKIRWVDDALVSERLDRHRLTMKWQIKRAYRYGANTTLIHRKRFGDYSAIVELAPRSLGKLLKGILMLSTYPIVRTFYKKRAVKWLHKGIKVTSTSSGAIVSFFGINPMPYKNIK